MLIALLLALGSGSNRVAPVQVDRLELNHYYNDDGVFAYDQIIAYEWSPDYRQWHVREWCLVSDLEKYPQKIGGRWHAKIRVQVVSDIFCETYSNYDPERVNKRYKREEDRRPLRSILEK